MQFIKKYKEIKDKLKGSYMEIPCKNGSFIEWPKGGGVYLIWHKNDLDLKNLIYVGLTGQFKRKSDGKITFSGADFKKRTTRWTPYRFCESPKDGQFMYSFRFGPKRSNTNEQRQIMHLKDAYAKAIIYDELFIVCFLIDENNSDYSPALLESVFLTSYLKKFSFKIKI